MYSHIKIKITFPQHVLQKRSKCSPTSLVLPSIFVPNSPIVRPRALSHGSLQPQPSSLRIDPAHFLGHRGGAPVQGGRQVGVGSCFWPWKFFLGGRCNLKLSAKSLMLFKGNLRRTVQFVDVLLSFLPTFSIQVGLIVGIFMVLKVLATWKNTTLCTGLNRMDKLLLGKTKGSWAGPLVWSMSTLACLFWMAKCWSVF